MSYCYTVAEDSLRPPLCLWRTTSNELKVISSAKVNLFLEVIGKRPDGYHELNSIFYPIKFGDILEICKSERAELKQTGIKIDVDLNENLVWKAYELMKKEFAISEATVIKYK